MTISIHLYMKIIIRWNQGGESMERRLRVIKALRYPDISIEIIPGHFATRHSHINYYVDLIKVTCHQKMAKAAGQALASQYASVTPVDSIVCLDGGEVVAAFMAASLSRKDSHSVNEGSDISIVTPETNSAGQLILRDNTQNMIKDKSVMLLVAKATTGKTLNQAIDYIQYYGGRVSSICALFSAIKQVEGIPVNALFTTDDIPGYETYEPDDCPGCKEGKKIDALVNNYGYSKI